MQCKLFILTCKALEKFIFSVCRAAEVLAKVLKPASEDVIYHCLYGYYFLGYRKAALARIYGKSKPTISNWIRRYEEEQLVGRKAPTTRIFKKFDEEKRAWLVKLFQSQPILYQGEAARLFLEEFGEKISVSSISIILREAGLSWKAIERRAIQIQLSDVIRFFEELSAINWYLHQLVFLDEASIDNRSLFRKRGYGVRGKSLVYRGEFCRKTRISVLCFIGINGVMECYTTPGTFTRKIFAEYCRNFALTHSKMHPGVGSVWIMDGAAIHCDPNIINYLRSLGIIPIFLPAYSPFFNPIEIFFGILKRLLKKNYKESSKMSTELCIANAIDELSDKNMKGLFRKCGYIGNGTFDPAIGLKQNVETFGFDGETRQNETK